MASGAKDFLIRIFLEADTKGAKDAMESIDKIGKSLDGASRVGTKLSLALTAPLVAFAAVSVKSVADFESQMARVGAVSNATASELAALETQARELGATTRFSASDAAQAMGFLSMAGFKPSQTMGAMPSTLKLAAAAMLDMGTAADITSNILTGFGMAVEDLAHVNDVLVKGFTSSNTDLKQLGEAMKYVAPVARGAGQSIEDTVAAIGALGNAGIQGSMAGTSLRKAISSLLNPTRQNAKLLKDLGIATTDAQGKMRPLIDILADMASSGIQTSQVMELFGDRAGPAMEAMLAQGTDSIRRFSEALQNSEGTAEDVARKQEDTLIGAWKEIESAYEELQISLMKAGVFDALKEGIKVGINFLNWLNSATPEAKRFAVSIATVVAAVGPLTFALSKSAGMLLFWAKASTGFIASSAKVVTSLKGLQIGVNLTTGALFSLRTLLVTSGIGALIVGLGYAVDFCLDKFSNAKKSFEDFSEGAKDASSAQEILNKKLADMGNIGTSSWNTNYKQLIADAEKLKSEIASQGREILLENEKLKEQNYLVEENRKRKTGGRNAWARQLQLEETSRKTTQRISEIESARTKNLDKLREMHSLVCAAIVAQREHSEKLASEENKRLIEEKSLKKSIALLEKSIAQDELSAADKLVEKKKELVEIENDIAKERATRAGEENTEKRNLSLQKERTRLEEKRGVILEIKKLEREAQQENDKSREADRAKLIVQNAAREIELLRAKISGNKSLEKNIQRQISVERLAQQLKEQGKLSDKEALQIATDKLALEDELKKQNSQRELQRMVEEARVAGLRKQGLKYEADAIVIRQRATALAKQLSISYLDALNAVKEIDKLQNKGKGEKENGKLGTTYKSLEKQQAAIKKGLESNSLDVVASARKRQKRFEDKYGIGIEDDVREYKGRDRKTGRLVNAKVGKEFEENQRYSQRAIDAAKAQGEISPQQAQTSQRVSANKPRPPSLPKETAALRAKTGDRKLANALGERATGAENQGASSAQLTSITTILENVLGALNDIKSSLNSLATS